MAKMLDALARAQRDRELQRQSPASAPLQPSPSPGVAQALSASPAPIFQPVDNAADTSADANGSRPAGPEVHPSISDLVVGAHDNFSPITEQVRQVRSSLDTVLAEHPSRPIVVTSPVSGDGKTLVAANLAWVLTDNAEQAVLLIDADMRKPDQNQLFGVRRTPGLSEYLREQCSLEQAIHPTSMPNLSVLPAGRAPEKPTTLLSAHRLPQMIEELKTRFSWIIIDTPPLLPVTDAALITRHCVGLLLVVRMGRTHRKVIERAQDLLAEMRLPVLGCVLNEFTPQETMDHYYSRYYTEGYRARDRRA